MVLVLVLYVLLVLVLVEYSTVTTGAGSGTTVPNADASHCATTSGWAGSPPVRLAAAACAASPS